MSTETGLDAHTTVVLDGVTTHARPLILQNFRPDSCIASTLITIEVLDYFGLHAKAMPISVFAVNAEAAKMMADGATLEEVGEVAKGTTRKAVGGPWTIGVGSGLQPRQPGKPAGWAGHLIATLPDLQIIIDNSIDQISRPHKGLNFEPVWAELTYPAWWAGDEHMAWFGLESGATIYLDRRATDPDGYLRSNNWDLKGPYKTPLKKVIGTTIRAIKADLTAAAL